MAQLPTIRDAMKTGPGSTARCAFAPRWKSLKPCTRWQPPTTTSGPRSVHLTTKTFRSRVLTIWFSAPRCQVVGIGETGLDYFRLGERTVADMAWQRERFGAHPCGEANWPAAGDSHPQCVSDDTLPFEERKVRARRPTSGTGSSASPKARVAALDLGFSFPAS
jgi:hypothetical protein